MRKYRVVFGDGDPVNFGTDTFEALGLSDALFHIASLHSRRPVELWQDDVFLGRLEHVSDADGSFWRIDAN